ncbi:alpha/beta hydrolase [Liquorilactobacillus sicerae]|uniref:alpha/beta hydrolase n=1 Tax=Liquorilactobacillus sicerae TaxID=1416943 RepID=UPI002480040A|nr:alpha/beta hydrolase [Liquorilactobacillus sicerae]
MKSRKFRRLIWCLVFLVVLLVGITGIASYYLYDYAFEPQPRLNSMKSLKAKKRQRLASDQRWLGQQLQENWYQQAANQNLQLHAIYLPASHKSQKTIIVAHGYRENHLYMASYIRMFHQLGYNVLAPDDRGSVGSEGQYISFGWEDRLDYVKWIKLLLKRKGRQQQIGLFGVSMGGATVMMTSGQKLPSQVKAIVEDCGYSSIQAELSYELKQQFNLPSQPLITTAALVAKHQTGFDFRHASALDQLKHNHLPTFFIHGAKDTFVPTKMVYQNYHASAGPKKIWVVPHASHAMSYYEYPNLYRHKVGTFFAKYLK